MADDVQGVVAALGLERYVLVGHSMGGKVAQIVAARRPASLLGLLLVAPAPPTPMPVPEAQRGEMLASYMSRDGVEQALLVLAGSPLSQVSRGRVIEDTLRGAIGAKREWIKRGMIADVSIGLEAVTVPTIVVIGDLDRVEHESALRQAFGRFLPHATFLVLAGVGHLSPLERPGELAAACLDLLATLSAPDGDRDRTRAT
jgi:pimeloyl-ACP methyl ester carboxylesterase